MKSKNKKLNGSQKAFLGLFGIPSFLIYTFVCVVPLILAFRDSFTDWAGLSSSKKIFVGFSNYIELFKDPVFFLALKNDLVISFFKLITITALALIFSIAVTRVKLTKFEKLTYRYLLYLPSILPIVVITIVWKFVFEQSGLFNSLIVKLSGRDPATVNNMSSWISEHPVAIITFVAIWCGIGYSMIVLIAAINNVPNELYEACYLDGGGQWNQFVYVTLPGIVGQIRYVMIYIISSTLASNMGLVLPMTNGQPGNKSLVMGLYVYKYGLTSDNGISRVGYANAAAIILMIISFILCFGLNTIINKKTNY